MTISQFRFFLGILLLSLLWASTPAWASFNGSIITFSFTECFVIGLVIAMPNAVCCGVAELVGVKHRPPLWLGGIALGLGLIGLAELTLMLNPNVVPYGRKAGTASVQRIIDHIRPLIFFVYSLVILFLPALMSFALVTFLRSWLWRLIATWCISVGVFGWLFGGVLGSLNRLHAEEEKILVTLLGGALVSMLMWHAGFVLGQWQLRKAGIPPTPGPNLPRLMGKTFESGKQFYTNPPVWFGRFIERGFMWWLGGAVAYYMIIPILAAFGYKSWLWAMLSIEALITPMMGFAPVKFGSAKYIAGWALHGLAWSMIVGIGIWGIAASAGRFNAGRLAPLRLAAIVLPSGLLLWVAWLANLRY